MCLEPTTLVKLVDFQPVDSTKFSCLAKLYFPSRLWHNCWLSILGVGIPVHAFTSLAAAAESLYYVTCSHVTRHHLLPKMHD